MWQHVEHLITRLIITVNRHFETGGGGVRGAISFASESFINDSISGIDMRSYNG